MNNGQSQLIDPAVRGTETVLESVAKAPTVKRVVLTSSTAAINGNNDDKPVGEVYTEEDWNRTSTLAVRVNSTETL